METLYRIGTFFILAGLGLLIIFVGSIIGKEAQGIYLVFSFASFFLGFLLHRTRAGNDSGRFGTLRRMGERNRQRRKERRKKPERGNPLGGHRRPSTANSDSEEDNNGNGS